MFLPKDRHRPSRELAEARGRIVVLEEELRRVQTRDNLIPSLVTLPAFLAQLELDVQRAIRHSSALSVIRIDIDHFQHLNAKHGHAIGDMILVAVGSLLAEHTRAYDLVGRAGADEFAIMMPEVEGEVAKAAIERLLIELETTKASEMSGLSASAGIAALRVEHTPDTLFREAADALLVARDEGGGRAVLASGGMELAASVRSRGDANVVVALAQALEERDRYTGEHSESVVDLTARVGEALGLDAAEIEGLRTAALLHDIGKVGIPDEILHKPGPLDEREWAIMRQHPVIGERILRAIPGMGPLARVVRHEHERWDGDGYPDGIAAQEIPIGARIILACDAYHAMISDRPYRRGMSHQEAMAELTANAGSQFDPKVVEALVGYLFGRRQSGLAVV